ncbi:unnamed protein product [Orchesella dallaii]|uniref:MYND-type domain-containing protein n=1 Tax=Orchesella dallaii TaxID=48710 RepID=A0ABP1QKV8_9HEXA
MASKPIEVNFTQMGNPRGQLKNKKHVEQCQSLTVTQCSFALCDKPTLMYCTKCYHTPYCSEAHWKDDQKEHAKTCGKQSPYSFVYDEKKKVPPHFVFNNNHLAKGTQIISAEPFVIFPTLPDDYSEDKEKSLVGLKRICYKCHDHFYSYDQPEQIVGCNWCGIRFCGLDCRGNYHSSQECDVLKKNYSRTRGVIRASSETNMRKHIEFYLDLCVLRVLVYFSLGLTNTFVVEQWKRFQYLSLLGRFKNFKKTTKNPYDGLRYMEFTRKSSVDILEVSLKYVSFDRDLLRQVYKIMIVFWEEFEMQTNIMSRVIVLDRHFLSQSYCAPNLACVHNYTTISGRQSLSWCFYTLKEIPANTNSTMKLLFDFSPRRFMPLPLRIMYLNEINLKCEAPRCTLCEDATDGGTHSGSTRCTYCQKGIYVEYAVRGSTPLFCNFPKRWSPEYVETVDWKCNECEHVHPFSKILETNQDCLKQWENVMRRPLRYCVISSAPKFIEGYEQSLLHPLNGVMLQVKFEFLMGTREKHFGECGLDHIGKLMPCTSVWFDQNRNQDRGPLRLFPKNWNKNELVLTFKRAAYSNDCQIYLEKANPNYKAYEYSEYSFLKLEATTMGLLTACHSFFMNLDEESATKFAEAGKSLAVERDSWIGRNILTFRISKNPNYPLLKWSTDLNEVVDVIKRDGRPISIAETILNFMDISLGKFMMGEGAFAEQRHVEGVDNWPQVKGTHSKENGIANGT